MAKRRIIADFAPKVAEVLRDADQYHERYYAVKTFGGPSLHFHRWALGLEGIVTPAVRCELIYGVLASWGMHRMGNGGSKMLPFNEFKASFDSVSAQIARARRINPAVMSKADWSVLESIFKVKAEKWVSDQGNWPWDTSVLKVIDNLVIGAMKGSAV